MGMIDTFIGLEVHIHLLTKSKVFCSCPSEFGALPNTHVCPVCLGYPGALPMLNRQSLLYSYMVGTALECRLSNKTVFERKNYFYPDMSKNYQISQYADPIGSDGWFEFETGGKIRRVRIHDIHLEEDAGKMIHEGDRTLIDYNRAGSSLLEIVTQPDFSSGEEAEDFLQSFRRMVRYLGVCSGNMEEGSLRCDANISVNRTGKGLGTKVEIKNLNSSRHVRKALHYEQRRQMRALKTGTEIIQETRLWDEQKQKTLSMRTKEAAHDYRYFPEPDIPPFTPDEQFFGEVEASMSELPLKRKLRLLRQYGLTEELAGYVCEERDRADFFEKTVVDEAVSASQCAKWMKTEVAKQLGRRDMELTASPLSVERFQQLLGALEAGEIHAQAAREVLEAVFDEHEDPQTIITNRGLTETRMDDGQLSRLVQSVLDAQPQAVGQFAAGDKKVIGFLIGQVMKQTSSPADPKRVRTLLERILESKRSQL
jgi:aspartyl-tRNA(Asn)/glutamyl-tRNA(Gln) amidotransferase subunit B